MITNRQDQNDITPSTLEKWQKYNTLPPQKKKKKKKKKKNIVQPYINIYIVQFEGN